MPAASDPGFLVLHALRLKGFADTSVVASLARMPDDEAARHLEKAAAAGQVTRREGRISGWALTPEGRARHHDLIGAELAGSGARTAIEDSYRRFLAVNNELLAVCTDWQLRDSVLNDHTDAAYDQQVIARLRSIDERIQPVCGDLGAALERFDDYGPRFATAITKVEAGERDWFAKPMIDSYHTVWFELHEDLLATLGIERSKEGSTS
ncbi:MAG TPA: hypothetical protein VM933_09865 [Acidimicrobiales bacterium]|nr:hypothetical protein [Acidimicrobiales bacterium]